jgi:hypothetical protein
MFLSFFILVGYSMTLPASNGRKSNDEFETIWGKRSRGLMEVLSQHLHEETEKNQEKPH